MRPSLKLFTSILLSSAVVTGCEMKPKEKTLNDVITEVGKWNMSSEKKAKYSHLGKIEARTMFIRDTYLNQLGQMETKADRNRLTAAVYLNYMMMQGQAIPNYCKGMGLDISEYQSAFYSKHRREESGLAKILTAEGTSLADVHTNFVPRYKTAAKYELMSTGSSYSACKKIKDNSAQLSNQVGFSKLHPTISQSLRNMN